MINKILILLLIPSWLFAYTAPQLETVTKPTPGNTYTVCSSGCTYTDLEDADGSVVAGDLLQIKSGTYNVPNWNSSAGTSGNEIVIEPFGDGKVYLETSSSFITTWMAADYVIIDGGTGLDIVFQRSTGDASNGRTLITVVANDVTIYRCLFQGPTGVCSETDNGLVSFGSPTTVVANSYHPERTRLYNCELDGGPGSHKGVYVHGSVDGEIKGNIMHDIYGNNIQLNPRGGHYVDGLDISGNVLYDGGPCATLEPTFVFISGMTSAQGDPPYIRGVGVYNNLLWSMNGSNAFEFNPAFDGCVVGDPAPAAEIYNNTVYNINEGTVEAQYGVSLNSGTMSDNDNEVVIRNNIFYNIKTDPVIRQTGSGVVWIQSDNFLDTGDPGFQSVDDTNDNFLKISSANPGYDTNPPVTLDYFGDTRDTSTPDIGADEYAEALQESSVVGSGTSSTFSAGNSTVIN